MSKLDIEVIPHTVMRDHKNEVSILQIIAETLYGLNYGHIEISVSILPIGYGITNSPPFEATIVGNPSEMRVIEVKTGKTNGGNIV